jgi:hypothetical protein
MPNASMRLDSGDGVHGYSARLGVHEVVRKSASDMV